MAKTDKLFDDPKFTICTLGENALVCDFGACGHSPAAIKPYRLGWHHESWPSPNGWPTNWEAAGCSGQNAQTLYVRNDWFLCCVCLEIKEYQKRPKQKLGGVCTNCFEKALSRNASNIRQVVKDFYVDQATKMRLGLFENRFTNRSKGSWQISMVCKHSDRFIINSKLLGCAYCGGERTADDHIIPQSRCGHDVPENILRVCGSCNSRKGGQTAIEYVDSCNRRGTEVWTSVKDLESFEQRYHELYDKFSESEVLQLKEPMLNLLRRPAVGSEYKFNPVRSDLYDYSWDQIFCGITLPFERRYEKVAKYSLGKVLPIGARIVVERFPKPLTDFHVEVKCPDMNDQLFLISWASLGT